METDRLTTKLQLVKLTALLSALFLACLSLHAQGTIQGRVVDPLGTAVPGADIALEQSGSTLETAKSTSDGTYQFQNLKSGRYRVTARSEGFSPYVGQELFVGATGVTKMDVPLQTGPLRQEVVVSATGSEIPLSQVGSSIALISKEEIQAENKLDVLENLRQVSGAQITQTSQRGGVTSLFIRGGESSFNKVMIDGVPANDLGGGFDFAQVSNGGVGSIEVLKGANSVLYGADALAGVVNITTERGTSSVPELKVSADGGNFGTHFESASLSGAFRQFDYYSLFSRFDTAGSYPNNFFHNATYAGNFGWTPTAKTSLRVTYRRNWTDLGSPNGLLFYGIADNSLQKNQNSYLSGTLQNQTTPRWHNLFRFSFGQFNSSFVNPSPTGELDPYGFGNYLGNTVTIHGANGYNVTGQAILDYAGVYPQITPDYEARRSAYAQSDYRFFRDWVGTFGFRYEHENGSGFTRDNYSYFGEGHGSVAHRLYVTGGVGFEKNAVFGFAASPRASAAYYLRRPSATSFFSDTKLRFNFGKAIKEPSTFQQANQVFALLTPEQRSQFAVGQIGPERSQDIDAGISQGIWNGRIRLDAVYFRNRFYDLITYLDPTSLIAIGVNPEVANATGFGAYVNATSTRSQGTELDMNSDLGHGLRLRASYTRLNAEVTKAFGPPAFNPEFPNIPIGAFSPLQGQRPFRRAPNSGTIGLYYSHRRFVGAFVGYMVGKRDDTTALSDAFFGNTMLLPNRNLAPAYQKFDLSGRYTLSSLVQIYTSIENLFSQHYQAAFGFPAAPFTIRSGLTLTIGGENWRK
jgi:vitamin B12 transporter